MVVYNHVTGFPFVVIGTLNRKIGQYKRSYGLIKVGITGQDPNVRFNQHRRDFYWDKMIVIYESSSSAHCNVLETILVDCHYNDLVNVRSGGGSKLSAPGKNYVYVLLRY